jgi:hypothetical protein
MTVEYPPVAPTSTTTTSSTGRIVYFNIVFIGVDCVIYIKTDASNIDYGGYTYANQLVISDSGYSAAYAVYYPKPDGYSAIIPFTLNYSNAVPNSAFIYSSCAYLDRFAVIAYADSAHVNDTVGKSLLYNTKTGEQQQLNYRLDYDAEVNYYPLSVTAL